MSFSLEGFERNKNIEPQKTLATRASYDDPHNFLTTNFGAN